MASEAEERLRALEVADLKRIYPDGRIIHELVVGQCRLDLACVTPDRIILSEIKSDLDVLDRLPAQVLAAMDVACSVRVVVGEKHWRDVERRRSGAWRDDEGNYHRHPDGIIPGLYRCGLFRPGPEGLLQVARPDRQGTWPKPRAVLGVLWSQELRRVLSEFWGVSITRRMTMAEMIRQIEEHLSGREIRRAVCRQLRARQFARAEPPVAETEAVR